MVVTLEAGDALYVPRGWGHEVLTTGDESIHVTFGFHRPTRHDVLRVALADAAAALAADPAMREHLAPAAPADLAFSAQAALQRALGGASRFFAAQQARACRPEEPSAGAALSLATPFFHCLREPAQGRLRVRLGAPEQDRHTELAIPLIAAPMIEALNRRGSLALEEAQGLSGLDAAGFSEVVEGLVRLGLLMSGAGGRVRDRPRA